jgi:hypothetical protein
MAAVAPPPPISSEHLRIKSFLQEPSHLTKREVQNIIGRVIFLLFQPLGGGGGGIMGPGLVGRRVGGGGQ